MSTGKAYRGQTFFPVTTKEEVVAVAEAQKQYSKEGAFPIEVYFSVRQIREPATQDAMRVYTKVRNATLEDWDSIFKNF